MSSIKLPYNAVSYLCVPTCAFPMLRVEIKREMEDDGFDATILFISGGFVHIEFQDDAQAVMFKLKYSELLAGS